MKRTLPYIIYIAIIGLQIELLKPYNNEFYLWIGFILIAIYILEIIGLGILIGIFSATFTKIQRIKEKLFFKIAIVTSQSMILLSTILWYFNANKIIDNERYYKQYSVVPEVPVFILVLLSCLLLVFIAFRRSKLSDN